MRTTHAAVRRRRAEAKPSQAACLQLLDPLEQLQHPEQAQKPQHRDRPAGEGHVAHEDDEEVEDVPRVAANKRPFVLFPSIAQQRGRSLLGLTEAIQTPREDAKGT